MDLPPTIELLLTEDLEAMSSSTQLSSSLGVDFAKEVHRQAEWTRSQFRYGQPEAGGFVTAPAGLLNPLSDVGKPRSVRERVHSYTDEFARSVALYSDVVVLPDIATVLFAEYSDHITHHDCGHVDDIFSAIIALRRLEPFIRAGVIRFANAVTAGSAPTPFRGVYHLAHTFVEDEGGPIRVQLHQHHDSSAWYLAYETPLFSPTAQEPVVYDIPLTDDELQALTSLSVNEWVDGRGLEIVKRNVNRRMSDTMESVLGEALLAEATHSVLLGASRVETRVLCKLQGIRMEAARIQDWEYLRSVDLPWISVLSPAQLLALRSDAQFALPRLREYLGRASRDSSADDHVRADIVAELRAQAAEVEGEIEALKRQHTSRYQVAMQSAAVSFVLYGLASGVPAVAATSLAAFLAAQAHLRSVQKDVVEAEAAVVASPAFALVAARRLANTA